MKYAYLTITEGKTVGTTFVLDPTDQNQLGRGLNCDVVLADPQCSRVHAKIHRDHQGWNLQDAESRNGTYVNGEPVASVLLQPSDRIRMGSTEFAFHCSNDAPTRHIGHPEATEEQIVQQTEMHSLGELGPLDTEDPSNLPALAALYRLSIGLVGADDPDEVIRCALDRIHTHTRASIAGFLWLRDDGELRPHKVLPVGTAARVQLSQSLTEAVVRKGQAVWIAYQGVADTADSLGPYVDAICVPLLSEDQTIGAIHLYHENHRFTPGDYTFAVAVGQLMAAALTRSQRRASLEADHRRLVASSGATDELLGESHLMRQLKDKINRVAHAAGCVLIRGESGSGKELVARAIHRASARMDRPLLSVNCAAIPQDLMESQLFGHRKGAFTGAQRDHDGLFQQADTGTLFLDEIGELTLEGQAKLLRILEGHPFLPVGGTDEIRVDVRVIAATNRDLRQFVRDRRFREDLYYRLSVFELLVPPLRDREGDIDLLMQYFLDHFRVQHGRPELVFSDATRAKMLSYSWPGNVRQLRNVIDSATVLATDHEIRVEDIGLHDAGMDHLDTLRIIDWEQKLIREALDRTARNVPAAAQLLGVSRATLYRKIDEYKITK